MGRVSMPIMNKTGYSMYWNSMWDDKINYSRSLKDSIFIKDFIYVLFEGGYSYFFFLDLKNCENNNNFLNLKKKYSFHTKKIFKKNDIGSIISYKLIKKKKNKFRPYLSKIWILNYQTWVVVYFYIYSFNLSIFFKRLKSKFKYSSVYTNIILKYYDSSLKIKYDYENHLKNSKNSIF